MSTNSTYVHSTKISTKLSITSLAFNVKKITRVLVSAILAVTGLFSAASHAQIQPMKPSLSSIARHLIMPYISKPRKCSLALIES